MLKRLGCLLSILFVYSYAHGDDVKKVILSPESRLQYYPKFSSITIGDLGFITQVLDEGTLQGSATWFNFVGSGVTAACSGGTCTITINGGGSGGGGGSVKMGTGQSNLVVVSSAFFSGMNVISDGSGASTFTFTNATNTYTVSQTYIDSTTFLSLVQISSALIVNSSATFRGIIISSNGALFGGTTIQRLTIGAGTVGVPSLVFGSRHDTGLYNSLVNGSLDFSYQGTRKFSVSDNFTVTDGQMVLQNGSAAAPAFQIGCSGCGMYYDGLNEDFYLTSGSGPTLKIWGPGAAFNIVPGGLSLNAAHINGASVNISTFAEASPVLWVVTGSTKMLEIMTSSTTFGTIVYFSSPVVAQLVNASTIIASGVIISSVPAGRNPEIVLFDGDVQHGMTAIQPTNAVGALSVLNGTAGGASFAGISDMDATGFRVLGIIGHRDPAPTTPAVVISALKMNAAGTGASVLDSSQTVLSVTNFAVPLLTVLAGGSVGIGTTQPEALFQVRGGTVSTVRDFTGNPVSEEHLQTIQFTNKNSKESILDRRNGLFIRAEDHPGVNELNVTDATNADPIVITVDTAHGYATGDRIMIYDVGGNTAAIGSWAITVLSADTFSLNGAVGDGAYTSGGTATNKSSYNGLLIYVDPNIQRRSGGLVGFDDEVNGMIITNSGTKMATDAIFVSESNGVSGKAWNTIFAASGAATNGIQMIGVYDYAVDFGSALVSSAVFRTPNNAWFMARNVEDTANFNLMRLTKNNIIQISSSSFEVSKTSFSVKSTTFSIGGMIGTLQSSAPPTTSDLVLHWNPDGSVWYLGKDNSGSSGSGGGGASTLAVGTGSAVYFGIVSSPTATINFSSPSFKVKLTGGATAYVDIVTESLTLSSFTRLQSFVDLSVSAGRIIGGEISDAALANYVDVAAGSGWIRGVDSDTTTMYFFNWHASATIPVPSNSTRYIGIEYLDGIPQVKGRTAQDWNYDTDFPLGIAVNEGGSIYITSDPWKTGDAITNIIERFDSTAFVTRDNRTGGLILANTGTRNVSTTAGALLSRLSEFSIGAVDTSGSNTFDVYYRDGSSGFTKSAGQTAWDNTQYDDGDGGLAALTALAYTSRWFYLMTDGSLAMLYGQSQDLDLADILNESPPSSLPDRILRGGILIGRFIIRTSGTTPTVTQSAFGTAFTAGSVTSFTDLSGQAKVTQIEGYESFKSTTAAEIDRQKVVESTISTRINALQVAIATHTTAIAAISSTYTAFQVHRATADTEMVKAFVALSSHSLRVDELQADLSTHSIRIDELQADLSTHSVAMDARLVNNAQVIRSTHMAAFINFTGAITASSGAFVSTVSAEFVRTSTVAKVFMVEWADNKTSTSNSVEWSGGILNMPAGFADGTDDGGGSGGVVFGYVSTRTIDMNGFAIIRSSSLAIGTTEGALLTISSAATGVETEFVRIATGGVSGTSNIFNVWKSSALYRGGTFYIDGVLVVSTKNARYDIDVASINFTNTADGVIRTQNNAGLELLSSSAPNFAISTISVNIPATKNLYIVFAGSAVTGGLTGDLFVTFNNQHNLNRSPIYAVMRTTGPQLAIAAAGGKTGISSSSSSAVGMLIFGVNSSTQMFRMLEMKVQANIGGFPKAVNFSAVAVSSVNFSAVAGQDVPRTSEGVGIWSGAECITRVNIGFAPQGAAYSQGATWAVGSILSVYGRDE